MYLQSKLNSRFAILFLFFIFFYITNASTNEKDYFLTLKNNKVNVRQGPSFDYPIKFIINNQVPYSKELRLRVIISVTINPEITLTIPITNAINPE